MLIFIQRNGCQFLVTNETDQDRIEHFFFFWNQPKFSLVQKQIVNLQYNYIRFNRQFRLQMQLKTYVSQHMNKPVHENVCGIMYKSKYLPNLPYERQRLANEIVLVNRHSFHTICMLKYHLKLHYLIINTISTKLSNHVV